MAPHRPFQDSFWSPTASVDSIPNFTVGFNVLHKKLKQSQAENKVIVNYIKQRIAAEKAHAATLTSLVVPLSKNTPFDQDIGASLKQCFQVVCAESTESSQEHLHRAQDLHITALDPLLQFSQRYDRIITQSKQIVENQIQQFQLVCKQLEQAKITYTGRCKSLLAFQPDFRLLDRDKSSVIQLEGVFEFSTRDHVWQALEQLVDPFFTEQDILQALVRQQQLAIGREESKRILGDLVRLGFIKKNEENTLYHKLSDTPTENTKGFWSRWSNNNSNANYAQKDDLVTDMFEADKDYRKAVMKVEKLRIQTEQILFVHYEEMESLELERIQTIKHAFISMAASLSNAIPRCKELFDNLMLYQETLKPDKDVQFIVEQYRTGHFCPKPILYENYFHGTASDQLFGVPLEEITRVQNSLVPQLISQGLMVVESGFSRIYEQGKAILWTMHLPLDKTHAAREELNTSKIIDLQVLEELDPLVLASLIRLYLLELPECLFTFELYEPCKLLYSNQQDKDSRLASISKLLTTLPTPNYHTTKTLFHHFYKLVQQYKTEHLSVSLAKSFSYILMRPQIQSKVSTHEHHAQRLLQDLIENFDIVFTQETSKAQEENSNRPAIIIPLQKPSSLDETKRHSYSSVRSNSSGSNKRSSILSFMRASQSAPTTTSNQPRPTTGLVIPSSSTLFEDPDEVFSSGSSSVSTPPHTTIDTMSKARELVNEHYMMSELDSLDSFFEDEDE
ncbi:hypothetical protein CU098_005429 [Rhizopus stolonifer]|uniref:Rho-GAP domain-containing protein n=1 Tax=Rhizopus stolonifer TaxID=4846 RepID=A0A367JQI9_RHIST|nr:hypothetical protein CU098_005429 [Rhizopus stolonifer]